MHGKKQVLFTCYVEETVVVTCCFQVLIKIVMKISNNSPVAKKMDSFTQIYWSKYCLRFFLILLATE